jgi:hypothetical protein
VLESRVRRAHSIALSLIFITRVAPHSLSLSFYYYLSLLILLLGWHPTVSTLSLSLSLLLAGRLARARAVVAGGRGPPRARAPGPTRGLGTRDCLTARPRARELTELRGTARAPAARGPGRTTRAL